MPSTEPYPVHLRPAAAKAVAQVLDLLDERFGVDSLWIFGSEATGRVREESDLDLAALFRKQPTRLERIELRSEAEALVGRPVDVVDLDEASPILADQVLRHGRLLVDRNPDRRLRFEMILPSRYEDLLIVLRPVDQAMLRRFRSEERHG